LEEIFRKRHITMDRSMSNTQTRRHQIRMLGRYLEDSITIFAPLAGIDIAHIDIAVTRNILTISGERVRPALYAESSRLLVSECFYGPFSRSVILPENLAFNKIEATMEDNLLAVGIPKLSFPSKSIKINKLES
jgi:HSP20 family molecular chaperone IbpA